MPIPVRQRLQAKAAAPAVASPAPQRPAQAPAKQVKPPKPKPKATKPAPKPQKPPAAPKTVKTHLAPTLDPRAILMIPTVAHRLNCGSAPKNKIETFYSPADFPEVPVTRGVLKCKPNHIGRPFLFIKFVGPDGARELIAPWRGDWPLSTEIVSLQQLNLEGHEPRLMLIGLDPERMAESREVFAAATAAYVAWKPKNDRIVEEKKAAKRAAREARGSAKKAVEK